MKPDLAADDRPAGPQIVNEATATGPFDDGVQYAAYPGQAPDYVMGTDWKRLAYQASEAAAAPPGGSDRSQAQDPEPEPQIDAADLAPAVYEARAAADAAVPAVARDDAYEDSSRSEKTPTAMPVDIEDEAPPAAAGDTRLAP